MAPRQNNQDEKWFTVEQFCEWAGISRSLFYVTLVPNDQAPIRRKIGAKTVILKTDAEEWMKTLPKKEK